MQNKTLKDIPLRREPLKDMNVKSFYNIPTNVVLVPASTIRIGEQIVFAGVLNGTFNGYVRKIGMYWSSKFSQDYFLIDIEYINKGAYGYSTQLDLPANALVAVCSNLIDTSQNSGTIQLLEDS